ncbi:MAG: DUF6702 family protein [Sediminibacterium sp.]|jgi:hypothetical protein|nr:hypothetical protein [Chitinophagaceae bacterium]MCA6445884.1 hypothetical protein [Chitinophagaceae bacterium]
MVNSWVQWLASAAVALIHPFFVSVIEIQHNPKEASAEISVRIFTDDLEKTLQPYSKEKIDLLKPINKAATDQVLSNYILKTVKIKVNGQTIKPNFLGFENIKESTWSYFEATGISDIKKIEIDCSLLHDFEKNQINIFHIKVKGQDKSYKLDYPERLVHFDF